MTDTTVTSEAPPTIRQMLDEPIDRDRVKGREGPSGRNLSYLSQSDVKGAANRIFGHGGWSYETVELVHIGDESITRDRERTVNGQKQKVSEQGVRVAYRAHVRVTIHALGDASYTDWGYGEDQAYNGSRLQQHELAVKEAVSDAYKRAMVALGDQFGLSLYDEAIAMRSGGGRGKHRRDNQTAPPPGLTDTDLAAVHAERNKFDVSERDLKWLARFVGEMPNLTSMREFPRSSRRSLIEAIHYYASNPGDAMDQMRAAGVEPPPDETPPEAPADEGPYP